MNLRQPSRGEIGIGDLLRALHRLHAGDDDELTRAIADVLRLDLRAPTRPLPQAPTPSVGSRAQETPIISSPAPSPLASPPQAPGRAAPPWQPEPPPPPLPEDRLPVRIVSDPAPPVADDARPAWLDEPYRLLSPTLPKLARHALLPERTARGVLVATVTSARCGDAIDVAALTRCLAQRRLPARLPRLPETTGQRGCQLLLDFSDSMLPWWEDLRALARQATAVFGREGVDIFEFAVQPAGARRWDAERQVFVPWRVEPGRPLLVATGFGIRVIHGQRAPFRQAAEWRAFVADCRAADAALSFFFPWPRNYQPTDLGLHPQIVHWHPATSAAMLRRQRGLARRVAR